MSGLSFKIDRPPGGSLSFSSRPSKPQRAQQRQLDSDDEDDGGPKEELLAGYGAKGSIRRQDSSRSTPQEGPLVIPSQPNTDWRALAQARRAKAAIYLPEGARIDGRAETPVLREVGPDANRDVINASAVQGGLQKGPSTPALSSALADASLNTPSDVGALTPANAPSPATDPTTETEDQRALRELLSGQTGDDEPVQLDAISVAPDAQRTRPPTEDDAFRMDIETRPDSSTAEDYVRVPIEQFGAALLRGMGWQRSEAKEAHIPAKRPALLGLGAKESALPQEEKDKNGRPVYKKPEPRFMPLVRQDTKSLPPSRDRSRSPTSREASEDERRRKERRGDRDRDYDSGRSSRRGSDREGGSSSRRDKDDRSRRDRYSDDEERRRRRDRDDRRERDRDRR